VRREEKILLWSSNLWYFGAGLLGPLFAIFTQRVGGDVFSIAWVWSAYLLSMGILVILIGWMSDRRLPKIALVNTGYALNAIFTFGYLFVDSPLELLFVQVCLGFATALAAPAWTALYDRYSGDGKKDGYTWGLESGFEKIATGLAILAGGFIVTTFSFETLFIIMGIFQIFAFLIQVRLRK